MLVIEHFERGAARFRDRAAVIEGDGYKTLEDGETVEYEAEDGPKGLKALKVRRTVTSNA